MSAEFRLRFATSKGYEAHLAQIASAIRQLPSFVREEEGRVFLLKGDEEAASPERWTHDVRIVLHTPAPAHLEISAHPPSIERDLKQLFAQLRRLTDLVVEDEDGEASAW